MSDQRPVGGSSVRASCVGAFVALLIGCSNGATSGPPPTAGAGGSGAGAAAGGAGGSGGGVAPGSGGSGGSTPITGTGGTGGGTGGSGGSMPPRDGGAPDRGGPAGDGGGAPLASGPGVTLRSYDLKRTGANLGEKVLTPTLVGSDGFGKLYCNAVDDEIYGQILYLPGLDLGAKGRHNTLIVTTMNDSVYAFDADGAGKALWEVHYTDAARGITPVPAADLAKTTCGTYTDVSKQIGILSTPAIDTASGTMYVVARTKEPGPRYVQKLHAINVSDGTERAGSPVTIQGNYPGNGDGSRNGMIPFDSMRQNQRMGLLLLDGVVYIGWSAHCDEGPYHGWIMGYDAKSLQQVVVWVTTPEGGAGGVWMAGQAPSVDDDGTMLIVTGNGQNIPTTQPSPTDTTDYKGGESILKLRRMGNRLDVVDWFVPSDYLLLEKHDLDLGGCGAMLIPGSNAVVTGGKDGKLYLVDRTNMGHQTSDDSQAMSVLQVTPVILNPACRPNPPAPAFAGAHIHGTPVYWKSTDAEYLYVMGEQDYLRQYKLGGGKPQQVKMSPVKGPIDPARMCSYTMPGGIMTLSANGADPASGVVWVNMPISMDANNSVARGVLRAFSASDVSKELWNSEKNAARDSYGNLSKFNPATVYNGKVYEPTFSRQYCVYGALN